PIRNDTVWRMLQQPPFVADQYQICGQNDVEQHPRRDQAKQLRTCQRDQGHHPAYGQTEFPECERMAAADYQRRHDGIPFMRTLSHQCECEEGIRYTKQHHHDGGCEPVRVMPVDAGRMRIAIAPSPTTTTHDITHPQAMKRAQATLRAAALGRCWI